MIDNAANYNQQENVTINIRYYLKDEMHYFEIEDNGIGISPEYHDHVFDMFKRLNHRASYTGSGMGLNIAQKLTKRIGGEITILRSEENKGSTFLLSFPVVKAEATQNETKELIV